MSLLTAVEEWIAGRGKTSSVITKKVSEVAGEFLTSKRVEGVGVFHLEDRKYRMNKFATAFPGRIDPIGTHEIEVWLNGLEVSGRTRSKRYLPRNEPTAVEDVAAASAGNRAIEIYTSQGLRLLLSNASARLLASAERIRPHRRLYAKQHTLQGADAVLQGRHQIGR